MTKESEAVIRSRKKRPEYYKAYLREYRKKNRNDLWSKVHPEYFREYKQRPEVKFKNAVRAKVYRAIKTGKMKRGVCESCGISNTQAHHDDYNKPLDVRWLCREHHENVHHIN